MGFFKDFMNWANGSTNESSQEKKLLKQAEEIVKKEGKEISGGIRCIKGRQYYVDKVYEGYGFKIVIPDPYRENEKGVYVNYDGKRVLDYKTYIQGKWEDVFSELYQTIDAKEYEIEKEMYLMIMQQCTLSALASITKSSDTIYIGNGIKIVTYENTIGSYDAYDGTDYRVYKDEELVCDYYKAATYGTKVRKYIPGSWEKEVDKYAEEVRKLRQQQEQQKADNAANERIKQLRKLRGED